MSNGFIKIYRKMLGWEWYAKSEMVHLFLHLLLKANYTEKKWRGITVKRGQLITGLHTLNKETGISIRTLRTCLIRLQKTGEVVKQSNNQYSIITICNYDIYNSKEENETSSATSDRQASDKRPTTTKNDKNDKNDKNINIPSFQDFKEYALKHKPTLNIESLKLKYLSWKENGWKDGNDKEIKNWKSKLLNTIPHIPNISNNKELNKNPASTNLTQNFKDKVNYGKSN